MVDPKATGIMAMLEKELAGDHIQAPRTHGFWLSCHLPGTRIHEPRNREEHKATASHGSERIPVCMPMESESKGFFT